MEVIRPSILKNVHRVAAQSNKGQMMTGDAICWRSTHSDDLCSFKTDCQEPVSHSKACQGQDSDVDSGIVGCGKGGQRVGSTSSTDTDSSQDSRPKRDYCSPAALHQEQIQKISGLHFRTSKRNSSLTSQGGPVKGDHSVLKECNRRAPTPLTVFAEPNYCVRFDEHLQLSEQSIRRSCRKLFATLYAQRFSYPSIHSQIDSSASGVINPPNGASQRNRSSTLPETALKKQASTIYERHRLSKNTKYVDDKENVTDGSFRKVVSWNLGTSEQRMLEQMTVPKEKNQKVFLAPTFVQKQIHQLECPSSFKASTDSGLGECRSNKCKCSPQSSVGYSSQSSTSSNSSSHCSTEYAKVQPILKNPTLVKSSSCSIISNMMTPETQCPVQLPNANTSVSLSSEQKGPLQKTSSCTNILSNIRTSPSTSVPVYNDAMMHHVYAQLASVVPDDSSRCLQSVTPTNSTASGHLYDYVKPLALPTYPVPKNRSSAVTFRAYKTSTMKEPNKNDTPISSGISYSPSNQTKDNHGELTRVPTPSELYVPLESRLVPYRRRSRQENPYTYTIAGGRPTTMNSEPYLKSALKHSKDGIIENESHTSDYHCSQNGNVTTIQSEAEYAIVDKSKKNRFSSLPTLNRFESNSCITDEEKDRPPVPPKKNLHKSEVDLFRSRSSSPKKSFLEKVNGLTKSAKNVFQKAFSTERIYRPEKEERMEATGLARSKSFIKGLRASISKKRKKNKPPMAELVPQSSYNPLWDDEQSSSNPSVRGQLLQLNLDGSQVVELSKPHNRPYGFFVARGRVRNSRGVFVSRMRDQETQKQLAGLLDIGDEILEIEGFCIKDADIMKVNELMSNKNKLLLTVLPYICRKDI